MKIKRNLLILFVILLTSFTFMGCNQDPITINVENSENISGKSFGVDAMIEIGGGLYYDSTTMIVYWWNGDLSRWRSDTTPSPYYAPNGLPYKYSPETNTFEEIEVK